MKCVLRSCAPPRLHPQMVLGGQKVVYSKVSCRGQAVYSIRPTTLQSQARVGHYMETAAALSMRIFALKYDAAWSGPDFVALGDSVT